MTSPGQHGSRARRARDLARVSSPVAGSRRDRELPALQSLMPTRSISTPPPQPIALQLAHLSRLLRRRAGGALAPAAMAVAQVAPPLRELHLLRGVESPIHRPAVVLDDAGLGRGQGRVQRADACTTPRLAVAL